MKVLFILVHIAVCIGLVLIVLLQKGKGAGMGAAFGGSSQAVFGGAGATTFMHKLTTVVAVLFMFTSLGLTLMFGQGASSSVMEDVSEGQVPAAQDTAEPGGQ
ncbi:MAG: preprotein translocase subunit SecG [Desulfatiglandaceae bacterium]